MVRKTNTLQVVLQTVCTLEARPVYVGKVDFEQYSLHRFVSKHAADWNEDLYLILFK